jgi:hypothetical protein
VGKSNFADWLAEAAKQFDQHEKRTDGARVAEGLTNGLTILRDSLYQRIHKDVEKAMGVDSMLVPVSEIRAQRLATEVIEAYQIAESALATRESAYLSPRDDWYLEWLARLRTGRLGLEAEAVGQSRGYLPKSADQRRLWFADALARAVPESRQVPLVLFRLMPLSVWIVTACAFGDRGTARNLRAEQLAVLPAIADCHLCGGRLLEGAEQCRACGNPLWKYEWLTVAD